MLTLARRLSRICWISIYCHDHISKKESPERWAFHSCKKELGQSCQVEGRHVQCKRRGGGKLKKIPSHDCEYLAIETQLRFVNTGAIW